jgi:hypothetical protein
MGSVTREELLDYLRTQKEAAAPLAKWIADGLKGPEYGDARVAGDDWAKPIFMRLLPYDQELARMFNDDGGERYPTRRPGEYLERRLEQLEKVVGELEQRHD